MKLFSVIIVLAATLALPTHAIDLPKYVAAPYSKELTRWLKAHPQYRLANSVDCECTEEIATVRKGQGGVWKPMPGYEPYFAAADFDGDGVKDFAVVVRPDTGTLPTKIVVFLLDRHGRAKEVVDSNVRESRIDHFALFVAPGEGKRKRLLWGAFASEGEEVQLRGAH
ncbi:MAG TPA: hypothetical protein VFP68_13085 [Burkholderiaceae bacterium]|nr:hypothetical protein [Burkholderiaceae bacterium]